MSGGSWDYIQYRISDCAEDIQDLIERNGKKKPEHILKDEHQRDEEWYNKYPEDRYYYEYPPEVIEQFEIGLKKIKEAQIYIHRIDWLLCGDDGEETFLERLKEELNKVTN